MSHFFQRFFTYVQSVCLIHNKLRNLMATANEFVNGDDFDALLFLFQTQSNCVSS